MEKQAIYQVAEINLTYRPQIRPIDRPKVSSGKDAYEVFLSSWDQDKIEFIEQFKVMLLNRNNKVLGIYAVSTGGLAGCLIDIKLVFASALIGCTTSIILAHNHPTGNAEPSPEDLRLTKHIKEAGKLLDIKVVDHIIVTKEGYYSFGDDGVL